MFNRRAEEFEDLRAWNDYLEMVEGVVFDILAGGRGREEAEEEVRREREGRGRGIEVNRGLEREEVEMGRRREEEDRERARERRGEEMREQVEQRREVERLNREVLDRLQKGEGDAVEVTRRAKKVLLKKTSARRQLGDDARKVNERGLGLSIRGLKRKASPVVEKPYDPFGGVDLTPTRYVLRDEYENEWLEKWKRTAKAMAGGYSIQEYYARTMFEAFSGLGVFIEDEVDGRVGSLGVWIQAGEADGDVVGSKRVVDDVF